MGKRKLLFVMNTLHNGGAENSLISFLEEFDYNAFEVDLFLLRHQGKLINSLPSQVNLLPAVSETLYFDLPLIKSLFLALKKGRIDIIIARFKLNKLYNSELTSSVVEQKFWKIIRKSLKNQPKEYDICVGFMEKTPIYYCIDKVKAKVKAGFIRTDYEKVGIDKNIDYPFLKKLKYIFTNSSSAKEQLNNLFPDFSNKTYVIENVFSVAKMKKLATQESNVEIPNNAIVSIGRLAKEKNFLVAVEACKILVDKGYNIKWFVLGEGNQREILTQKIQESKLSTNFILLGHLDNIYPILQKASFYVHTSIFEGKSRAIQEAKFFEKPIVSTKYPSVYEQVIHEKNGLICEMNKHELANAIENLLTNNELKNSIILNIKTENDNYINGLNLFYKLLNEE